MKKQNITSNAFAGVQVELNVLEVLELKNFVEYCSKEEELYLQRKKWEERYYALPTKEEQNSFKEEFPKPMSEWGITDYREHLFKAVILLNKFIQNIPDISCKSIFDEKEDPEEILEQPVAHFE